MKKRAPTCALLAALAAPAVLGACLSWLGPGEESEPAPVSAHDRQALFLAAVSAFSGEDSGYLVTDLDPEAGTFTIRRIEAHGSGEEEIEVEVRVETRDEDRHEIQVLATRRRLAPVESAGGESRAALRRHRDEDVERAVLARIRESAAMFRVAAAGGEAR